MILALALADVKAGGWFGKVMKGKRQGTSNVGPVTGGDGRPAGDATNVVTDYVHVRGESRSHDNKFFKEITKAYKAAFEKAAKRVKNSDGKSGRVKFKAETDYYPFRMKDSLPVVKRAVAAVSGIGGAPNIRAANGGLDANWMVRHGVPTVTFGAGRTSRTRSMSGSISRSTTGRVRSRYSSQRCDRTSGWQDHAAPVSFHLVLRNIHDNSSSAVGWRDRPLLVRQSRTHSCSDIASIRVRILSVSPRRRARQDYLPRRRNPACYGPPGIENIGLSPDDGVAHEVRREFIDVLAGASITRSLAFPEASGQELIKAYRVGFLTLLSQRK